MHGLNQIWAPIASSGFQRDILQRRGKSVCCIKDTILWVCKVRIVINNSY